MDLDSRGNLIRNPVGVGLKIQGRVRLELQGGWIGNQGGLIRNPLGVGFGIQGTLEIAIQWRWISNRGGLD